MYEPDYAVPPGWSLRETIDHLGVTESELATRLGVSMERVEDILVGAACIDQGIATGLERCTGVPARVWVRLETNYRRRLELLDGKG